MAIEIVKPLKIEDTISGGEINFGPTEIDPSEDYSAAKGISFEGSTGFRVEKIGRAIVTLQPDGSQKPYYDSNGSITAIDFYNSATQITANRIARQQIDFDPSFSPTAQYDYIYDTDGTTVLRSSTATFTFSGYDVTNIVDNTTGSL